VNAQTRSGRRVLRNPAMMKRLPFLACLLVLLGFLQGDDSGGALIFWIGAAIVVLFGLRPSLAIAPEGLIVSNMLARRYLWEDIADVENHPRMYGSALRLHLTNGKRKYAWAVMNGSGGWGADWIEQTIAQVRGRWESETAGSRRQHDATPYLPPKKQSFWARGNSATWAALTLMVFFVGFGAWTTWDTFSARPAVYETLKDRGVQVAAHPENHHVGFTGRDDYYTLTVTYRGQRYSTHYHDDYKQFRSVPPGGTVPALVDPKDPEIIYTVADVRERTNAGFGVVAVFGIVMTLAGLFGLVYFIRRGWAPDPD